MCVLGVGLLALALADDASAIPGVEGTFEYTLDIPWRIEPNFTSQGDLEYGPVPIQIAVHDGNLRGFGASDEILHQPEPAIIVDSSLGFVCAVDIREDYGDGFIHHRYSFDELAEVEITKGRWPAPGDPSPGRVHEICRAWKGEDCNQQQVIGFTSEWHATLWHELRGGPDRVVPGADVQVRVSLHVGSNAACTGDELTTLVSDNRVHLGEAPLPRFDERWLYGDLHYHSQGTDNEGESGHSYRGVVRAMGSMGMDFVFATDHASNGRQIVDSDLTTVLARLTPPTFILDGPFVDSVLRDMSPERFAFGHELIHGGTGVNFEAAAETVPGRPPQGFLSHGTLPSVFLGGEVDVIPEIKEPQSFLPWGNSETWQIISLCGGQPADNAVRGLNGAIHTRAIAFVFDLIAWVFDEDALSELQCGLDDILVDTGNGVLLNDFQGVDAFDYGRLHIVYLPRDGSDPNAFVASDTGMFGGAGRRLTEEHLAVVVDEMGNEHEVLRQPLLPELESHGFFFAAHPLVHPTAGGAGPDGTPWSDFLLEKAFRSSSFLGLQFWNEDTRLIEFVANWEEKFTTQPRDRPRPPGGWCFEGIAPEGEVVRISPRFGQIRDDPKPKDPRKGGSARQVGYERLDFVMPIEIFSSTVGEPAQVPFNTPRAGFDSGLFWLSAHAPRTGVWQSFALDLEGKDPDPTPPDPGEIAPDRAVFEDSIETILHHGAFTWDRMNHWGLDARQTQQIEWLTEVEPRRVFMAGGSDAHGDLNYRQAGYFLGATALTDTAIGKPRNLVEMSAAASKHSQTQVVDALADGRFAITDGPALRIAIDMNGNGIIDDGDAPMGSVVEQRDTSVVPLLVQWLSTAEFGGPERIDLYVGARSSEGDLGATEHMTGRTYAPFEPGVRSSRIERGLDGVIEAPPYDRMLDNYWKDPTDPTVGGFLRIHVGANPGIPPPLSGTRAVELDLAEFPAEGNVVADRHFVRAVAVTKVPDLACFFPGDAQDLAQRSGRCIQRYAFTNPIWIQDSTFLCSAGAGVDDRAPTVACNAPATITPRDAAISFEATAADGCEVTTEVTGYDCFWFNPAGKRVDRTKGCEVVLQNGRITILDSGGVGDHITWDVTATDEAGNQTLQTCEIQVERPTRP
jgi:hypothetical protein